ncbi:SDR family oxidoreductase [Janthinobacterium sp. LB3P118]|uniref:SDR family oxidoreductase n=1 Tax=Janthinobacterium sp. LB3P118 TaxID=3424195 RepID=UPI003F527897
MVLGATGLMGSTLVPYLRQCGHTVFANATASGARADLTQDDAMRACLDQAMPDAIVNLIALTNVDECERSPQQAYRVNTRIVENIAAWMRDTGRHVHLIHISSDQVYNAPGPHREDQVALSNYYGFSKYAGELAAATVPHTILRTNFFGVSQCPGRTSFSDWLVRALRQGESITVFDDVLFSPLSLGTLVSLIEQVLARSIQGVFNVGSREGLSKADFAFTLAQQLNLSSANMRRGNSSSSPLTAYRPKDMRLDVAKFEAAIGMPMPILQKEIYSVCKEYENAAR